jgi:hypothetical protein
MSQASLESIHLVLAYFPELEMKESVARLLPDVISRYSQLTIFLTALLRFCLIATHSLVLSTLTPLLTTEPTRKCFRLIGGVLVERTVSEVEPDLKGNLMGVSTRSCRRVRGMTGSGRSVGGRLGVAGGR